MKNIRYASVGLSEREILCEQNLVIYITECQNNCVGCHTPYMHDKYGDYLSDYFDEIFETYKSYITCVCFMGEGLNSNLTRKELIDYCRVIHQNGKKTALYSGRDCDIEDWMYCFDYVKTGSYQKEYGSLVFPTTNQKLYKKQNNKFENITSIFWNN